MQTEEEPVGRLYVIVRADLPSGLQAAQAVHTAFGFAKEHWVLLLPWLQKSNYLVVVAVPDEAALYQLITDAHARGIAHSATREPDLNNEITAVALEPGKAAQRLCSSLPLALREKAMQ